MKVLTTGKYILDGKNVVEETDLLKWGRWMEKAERHVNETNLPGGTRISTVFLGIDHSFGDSGPILFETMIFGGQHDMYQERYSTWEEAEAGHQRALELIFEVS